MNLSKKGEGGTVVLKEILVPLLKSSRQAAVITILSFIGISLLIGDGVITPAISILSAVEGALLIPGLEKTAPECWSLWRLSSPLSFFRCSPGEPKKWQEPSDRLWSYGSARLPAPV